MKKKRRKEKIHLFLLTIVLVLIGVIISLSIIGKKLNPLMENYVDLEARRFTTLLVNQVSIENITKDIDLNQLFTTTKSSNDDIQTIDFNSNVVNEVLSLVTKTIRDKINHLDSGDFTNLFITDKYKNNQAQRLENGIFCEIPIGALLNNGIFANLGPKIPMKFVFIGDIQSNIKTKIEEYGINNALVTVSIQFYITERISMPLLSKDITVEMEVPLAIKLLQGKVPSYYQKGMDKNSSLFTYPLGE